MDIRNGTTTGDSLDRIVDRAHREGHGFVVVASGLDLEGDPGDAAARASTALRDAHDVSDVAVGRTPTEGVDALLLAAIVAPGAEVADLGTAVQQDLAKGTPVGVSTSVGQAGLTLEDAIAVALEGLAIARSSGASGPIHTELYELVRSSRERRPEAAPRSEVALEPVEPPSKREPGPDQDVDPFAREEAIAPMAAERRAPTAEIPAPQAPAPAPALDPTPDPVRDDTSHIAEIRGLLKDHEQTKERDRHARALLERRIAKLVAELDAAQGEIARLRRGGDVESGVASIYRNVQGLDDAETHVELKRALVEEIFRKNRAEQQRLAAREARPSLQGDEVG